MEYVIEIGRRCAGGEQDQPRLLGAAPSFKCAPACVPRDVDLIKIVHSGTAERTIGRRKTCGFDDMRVDPHTCGEPKDRSGVLRNIRLEKRNPHRGAQPFSGNAKWRKLYGAKHAFGCTQTSHCSTCTGFARVPIKRCSIVRLQRGLASSARNALIGRRRAASLCREERTASW